MDGDTDLEDAGVTAVPEPPVDAGADAGEPVTDPDAPAPRRTTEHCSRERLTADAETYLTALASADPGRLNLHQRVRYTENGSEQVLGFGLWLSAPRSDFARHFIDEHTCSSATEAVLRDASGRTVLGVRLRYVDDQLFEIESHVVPRNDQYYAPEQIIADGDDPWLQPISIEQRSPAMELSRVALDYFDSTVDARLLPPSAESCERRQNGALMRDRGSCRIAPGERRFEQQRVEVIDETTGVVVAMTKYESYIGMYFIKVQADTILDIEVVGGANSASTGW